MSESTRSIDGRTGPRVVLLGASNLRMALPTVVSLIEARGNPPMQILVACGHGRSYGVTTRVLGVELPSIGSCGLWSTLALGPQRPTVALLTDIGNDIMYGASAETIASWVERDVDRLLACGAVPLLVRIPLVTIESLSAGRYQIARSVLFPTRRVELDEVRQRARDLDRNLVAIAKRHGLPLVEPAAQWYGWDPIHIRRSCRAGVWGQIVAQLLDNSGLGAPARLASDDRRALARARPQSRRVLGFARSRTQPAARFASGTTVSLY